MSFDDLESLTDGLIGARARGARLAVTWLNHVSAPTALSLASAELAEFDVVGIDGKLLQRLVGGGLRTSADLVVPRLLPRLGRARVALLGGVPETIAQRAQIVAGMLDRGGEIVYARDGYDGLPTLEAFAADIAAVGADVVIVGLGAGLQERYAAVGKRALPAGGLILTCGGLLDQVLVERYYPRWAYPLRLNWLVRLAREPRRLWRRYSVDALRAVEGRVDLRRSVTALPGLWT